VGRISIGLNRWDFSTPANFVADVQRAELLGWDQCLVLCNPLVTWDPYVLLALAGNATARVSLAPFIDNPVLRHPAVLGNAIATVDAVAPGRARLVLGVGDTAVRFVGRRPSTVTGLEAAVTRIRRLLRGEPVDTDAGLQARMQNPREVPIWIAAGGPRTLRMAGRTCDGVYLRVGRDPSNLRRALSFVHDGASEAGRDPSQVGVGLVLHTIWRQNPREIAAISRSMAAGFYEYSPSLFDGAGLEWTGPPIGELHRLVWPDFHHAADLVASGEIVSFLPDRAATGFSLFGTPADIAAQLRESIAILGRVDVIVPHPVPTPTPDKHFSRWFAEDVMPLV
jgi:5,10-methylenetetrahydromethanopterin reductase